jgi:HAD superfamily hydrolase (TIGR01484 family)
MKAISELTRDTAQRLTTVLFDVDDTVLDHGRLTLPSLAALYRLQESGLRAVAVTGRPAAWGQVLVRQWPIDGVVAENGALVVVQRERRVTLLDRLTLHQREQRRTQLRVLVSHLRQQFPDLAPSDDAESRAADYTFDIGETRIVPAETVAAVSAYARARGARVTRSSIHLHVCFEVDDKATGALRFLSQVYGMDPTASRYQSAFIGDSENDGPCFAAFDTTIGVANFRGRPSLTPRYLTQGNMGAGFAEFVECLLSARGLASPSA